MSKDEHNSEGLVCREPVLETHQRPEGPRRRFNAVRERGIERKMVELDVNFHIENGNIAELRAAVEKARQVGAHNAAQKGEKALINLEPERGSHAVTTAARLLPSTVRPTPIRSLPASISRTTKLGGPRANSPSSLRIPDSMVHASNEALASADRASRVLDNMLMRRAASPEKTGLRVSTTCGRPTPVTRMGVARSSLPSTTHQPARANLQVLATTATQKTEESLPNFGELPRLVGGQQTGVEPHRSPQPVLVDKPNTWKVDEVASRNLADAAPQNLVQPLQGSPFSHQLHPDAPHYASMENKEGVKRMDDQFDLKDANAVCEQLPDVSDGHVFQLSHPSGTEVHAPLGCEQVAQLLEGFGAQEKETKSLTPIRPEQVTQLLEAVEEVKHCDDAEQCEDVPQHANSNFLKGPKEPGLPKYPEPSSPNPSESSTALKESILTLEMGADPAKLGTLEETTDSEPPSIANHLASIHSTKRFEESDSRFVEKHAFEVERVPIDLKATNAVYDQLPDASCTNDEAQAAGQIFQLSDASDTEVLATLTHEQVAELSEVIGAQETETKSLTPTQPEQVTQLLDAFEEKVKYSNDAEQFEEVHQQAKSNYLKGPKGPGLPKNPEPSSSNPSWRSELKASTSAAEVDTLPTELNVRGNSWSVLTDEISANKVDGTPTELNVLGSTAVKKLDASCISQSARRHNRSVLTEEMPATNAQAEVKLSSKLPDATRALDRLVEALADAKITSSKAGSGFDRLSRRADKIIWRNVQERKRRKTFVGMHVALQFSLIVCLVFGAQILAHTQHNQKVMLDEFKQWAPHVFPDDQALGYFQSVSFTGVGVATVLTPQLLTDSQKPDLLTSSQENYCTGWTCPSKDETKAENETTNASSTDVPEADPSVHSDTEQPEDLDKQKHEHSQNTSFVEAAADGSPELVSQGEYVGLAGASTWLALIIFAVAVSVIAICLNTQLSQTSLVASELPEGIE